MAEPVEADTSGPWEVVTIIGFLAAMLLTTGFVLVWTWMSRPRRSPGVNFAPEPEEQNTARTETRTPERRTIFVAQRAKHTERWPGKKK